MDRWLESLVPWGTEAILRVQAMIHGEGLIAAFKFLTFLGYEEFYLILLPLVYWCVHREWGVSLGYLSISSAWLNSALKYLFAIPRPSDPRIRILLPETSPSFPSGHAQSAVVNWGYLAYRLRNRVFWIVAVLLMLGIGFSRVVLGVHFPQDVLGGWLIGLVLWLIFLWVQPHIQRRIGAQRRVTQLLGIALLPILLIVFHPGDTEGLYPAEGAITPASALFGLGVGVVMERAWVRFRADGAWWRRGARFLLGLIVVVVLYVGPRLALPTEMTYSLEAIVRFLRYALLGWAVAFLCPWLFVRLRLAEGE